MQGLKLIRHRLADRLIHWLFAISVLILLATGFLPVVGVNFEWVTLHWAAGLGVLLFLILHIIRRTAPLALQRIWFGFKDIELSIQGWRTGHVRTGKYSPAQKLMHHGVALLVTLTLITGLFMMVRVDTPLWERNIYLFQDGTWGIIYTLHGICALALLSTVMLHIYFALRPEKLLYTRSMIKGWLTQQEFDRHHDPALWPEAEASTKEGSNG